MEALDDGGLRARFGDGVWPTPYSAARHGTGSRDYWPAGKRTGADAVSIGLERVERVPQCQLDAPLIGGERQEFSIGRGDEERNDGNRLRFREERGAARGQEATVPRNVSGLEAAASVTCSGLGSSLLAGVQPGQKQ